MKFLLDTHTFMWWDANSKALSKQAFEILSNTKNQIFLSTVSTWEITIKMQIGKLSLRDNLNNIVRYQLARNSITMLPITLSHTLKVGELPLHHKDPFDRLLIAQALVEELTILSKDEVFANYNAKVVW